MTAPANSVTPPLRSDPPALAAAKKAMRAAQVERRRRLFQAAGVAAADGLARRFLDAVALAADAAVAGYHPMGDEIDVLPLLARLAAQGHETALPVVDAPAEPLVFRRWRAGESLAPGPHGTRHPLAAAAPVVPAVLLVPLLAFDAEGYRLGYGGGYYDRTIAALRRQGRAPLLVGAAFAGQRVERVPRGPHDQPLDAVVTEAAAHWFNRRMDA